MGRQIAMAWSKGLGYERRGWRDRLVGGGAKFADVVFKLDPGEQGAAEDKVEEPLVGDCKNDEAGREGEKYYDEAAEVMVILL